MLVGMLRILLENNYRMAPESADGDLDVKRRVALYVKAIEGMEDVIQVFVMPISLFPTSVRDFRARAARLCLTKIDR